MILDIQLRMQLKLSVRTPYCSAFGTETHRHGNIETSFSSSTRVSLASLQFSLIFCQILKEKWKIAMISLSSKIPLRLHQIPCSKAYMHGAFVRYKLYHQGNHCHMVHLGMDKHHFSYYSMNDSCFFHLGESTLNFPNWIN